ncbi:hypothetical protein DAEQUDRAFT_651741, partial [Daedalea quercina L-15889]
GLHLFDFCLTVDQQIKFIWGRKLSIPSVLLLLMHFSTICTNIFKIALQFAPTCSVCIFLALALYDTTFALTALRVYAINGKHWALPLCILMLSMPNTIYEIVSIVHSQIISFKLMQVASVCIAGTVTILVANVLVLGSTWSHTFTVKRLASANGQKATLVTLLLRDG